MATSTADATSPFGTDPVQPEEVVTEPKTYLDGRFKSDADLEEGYRQADSKIGEQGTQIGELRASNKDLERQIASIKAEADAQVNAAREMEPATDYERKHADLFKQLEGGEITDIEYAKQSNALTADQVQADSQRQANEAIKAMEKKLTDTLAERDHQEIVDDFYKANDGFEEAQQSGKLEAIKQANPLYDDIAAFNHLKVVDLQQQLEDVKLKNGSKDAGTVIQETTTTMQKPTKPPTTDYEIKQSMLQKAALV